MARKPRLFRGDVLEVVLDDAGNKGYMILLDMHATRKVPLFGLLAVEPRPQGYTLEQLQGLPLVAQIMVFVDPSWPKKGRVTLPETFVWPDLYEVSLLTHKGKIFVYRYGEAVPYKEVNDGDDLGNAQPRDIHFPIAAINHYLKALRKANLYTKPEPEPKSPKPLTEEEEMSYAGVYGDVWTHYRMLIKDKKKIAQEATKSTLQKFKDELSCPDTGLQLYLGLAKAQLELGEVLPAIKQEALKRIEEEHEYLRKEEWLGKQAEKVKVGLLKS